MRQTNSPLTAGIHHCCFNQGLVSFFSACAESSHPKSSRPRRLRRDDQPTIAVSTASVHSGARYTPWQSARLRPCPATSVSRLGVGVRSVPTQCRLPQTAYESAPPYLLPCVT